MNYPESFKAKVRQAFGDQFDKMLAEGNTFLGRYLDDSSRGGFPVDEILLATSLDALQKKARQMKMKVEVYREWSEMYRSEMGVN